MTAETEQKQLGAYISTADIAVTGFNPRKEFDEESLKELAESIKIHGIIEPLVARPDGKDGYELVAGERRLKAAQMLGLETVPVVVRKYSDEQVREVMLLENLQRKDLKPLEEAAALEFLITEMGMNHEDIAQRIGKSPSWVYSRIRLLRLPEEVHNFMEEGKLGIEQALFLVPYVEWPVLGAMVKEIKDDISYHGDLSKSRVKRIVEKMLDNSKQTLDLDDFGWSDTQKALQKVFDFSECKKCKVPIKREHYNGKIHRVCLNAKCFNKKKREAKKKVKENEQKKTDKLAKSGKVDTNKLNYGDYKPLKKGNHWSSPEFDLGDCKGCKDRKTTVDNLNREEVVCTRPSCFDNKNRDIHDAKVAENKYNIRLIQHNLPGRLMKEKEILVHRAEDEEGKRLTTAAVSVNAIRYSLFHMTNDDDVYEIVLKDYAKKKPKKGWKSVLMKIPDKDLSRVFLSFLLNRDLEIANYRQEFDWSTVQNILPELFKGELPPTDQPCEGLWTQDNDEGICENPNVPTGAKCALLLKGEDAFGGCPVKGTVESVPDCHRLDMPGPCIGDSCASWDSEKGECTDDVKAELEVIEEPEDLEGCVKVEGELCDPGAFPECNDCEVYGAVEE